MLYKHSLRSRPHPVNIFSEKADVLLTFGPNLIQESFYRSAEFFVAVAGLAGGHHIASRALPSPRQWHHMIHGQVFGAHV